MVRVFGYCRIALHDYEELEIQKERVYTFAKDNGYEVADVVGFCPSWRKTGKEVYRSDPIKYLLNSMWTGDILVMSGLAKRLLDKDDTHPLQFFNRLRNLGDNLVVLDQPKEYPRVFGYCRTALPDDQEIERQEVSIREYAEKNAYDIGELVKDNGVSALSSLFERDSLRLMKPKMREGDVFVTKNVQTLGRNALSSLRFLVYLHKEGIIPMPLESPFFKNRSKQERDMMMEQLGSLMALLKETDEKIVSEEERRLNTSHHPSPEEELQLAAIRYNLSE